MIVVDNTLTGIEDALGEAPWHKGNSSDAIYDLQGRRVHRETPKGIYIRNGQKTIIVK